MFCLANSIVSILKWDARLSLNINFNPYGTKLFTNDRKHFLNHIWKVLELNYPDSVAEYIDFGIPPIAYPLLRFLALYITIASNIWPAALTHIAGIAREQKHISRTKTRVTGNQKKIPSTNINLKVWPC